MQPKRLVMLCCGLVITTLSSVLLWLVVDGLNKIDVAGETWFLGRLMDGISYGGPGAVIVFLCFVGIVAGIALMADGLMQASDS